MQKNTLATVIRVALYSAASIGGLSTVAIAQDTPDAAKKDEAMTLDAVTVLGSRIKRTETETALPVLTIDRAELERTGLTQVADILKELSINGPSLSLNTNNGNTSGVTRVNLRGCGSNRTLVLVNGKRWISDVGLGGSVDLSSIPFAAVERVEVLKEGASALYGTDAICGVINITTKSNFSGAQLKAYYGQYDQDDGARKAYDFTFGHATDRWSALLNASYTKQDAVSAGNRAISAVPLYGFGANTSTPGRASTTTPYGRYTVGGVVYTLDPTKPGCQLNQLCTSKSDFKVYDFNTDGYNFAPVNYLNQPEDTKALFGEGTYRILDNLRVRVNGFLDQRGGQAQLAAQPLSPLTIAANNVYNPFATRITGASFRPINFPRQYNQNQITRRFSAALEGDFEAFGKPFNWDVGASYGKNKFDLVKSGFEFTTKLNEALGPSFIQNGKAVCGTAAAPITSDGCVPWNVFGGPAGVTADMFNFVAATPRNVQSYRTDNYTANISAPIFALPAGDLAVAAGYEYRKERGSDTPDPLTAAGLLLNDVPYLPTKGQYDLNEFYGEVDVPIFKDQPFAKSLDISLAVRRSDYSSFGNTTNPKASLHWQPIDDLLVRGSWGKGFRAPSISELYSGIAQGRPTADDPCSTDSVAYAAARAACAAAGVPANFKKINAQTFLSTGGNANLKPETSTNKTFGFVYSPSYFEGFDATVDWYNIKIENAIGANSAPTILNNCYLYGVTSYCSLITRDLTGATFANPGEITNILGLNQNFVGGLEVEGFDFALNYKLKTDHYGDFRFNWANAYITYYGDINKPKRGQVNGDGQISSGNTVGQESSVGSSTGAPIFRLRSTLNAQWNINDFSFGGTIEYYSKISETCNTAASTAIALAARGITNFTDYCTEPGRVTNVYSYKSGTNIVVASPLAQPRNTFPSVTYVDLQGSWKAPWKGVITAGIRNLFDRKPPFSSDAFANSFDPQYRIPGRFYYASYQQNFDLFK
jgi:iron complex outermembrane receptor protein